MRMHIRINELYDTLNYWPFFSENIIFVSISALFVTLALFLPAPASNATTPFVPKLSCTFTRTGCDRPALAILSTMYFDNSELRSVPWNDFDRWKMSSLFSKSFTASKMWTALSLVAARDYSNRLSNIISWSAFESSRASWALNERPVTCWKMAPRAFDLGSHGCFLTNGRLSPKKAVCSLT